MHGLTLHARRMCRRYRIPSNRRPKSQLSQHAPRWRGRTRGSAPRSSQWPPRRPGRRVAAGTQSAQCAPQHPMHAEWQSGPSLEPQKQADCPVCTSSYPHPMPCPTFCFCSWTTFSCLRASMAASTAAWERAGGGRWACLQVTSICKEPHGYLPCQPCHPWRLPSAIAQCRPVEPRPRWPPAAQPPTRHLGQTCFPYAAVMSI